MATMSTKKPWQREINWIFQITTNIRSDWYSCWEHFSGMNLADMQMIAVFSFISYQTCPSRSGYFWNAAILLPDFDIYWWPERQVGESSSSDSTASVKETFHGRSICPLLAAAATWRFLLRRRLTTTGAYLSQVQRRLNEILTWKLNLRKFASSAAGFPCCPNSWTSAY